MLTKFVLAILVGSAFRVIWARLFMNKTMYYVPPHLVVLVMTLSMIADPRSGAFIVGVFIFDLIYFVIRDNDSQKEQYKKVLSYLLGKESLEEKNE